jgi:membrane protease YdiL (CAAX protease family)
MSLPDVPLLLADIAAEGQELTLGTMLAVSCVLAVLFGSLTVLSIWRARYLRGEAVIPMANRPLLRIPVPLLIFGLFIAVLMSILALTVSSGQIESAPGPPVSTVENGEAAAPDDEAARGGLPPSDSQQDVNPEEDAVEAESTTNSSQPVRSFPSDLYGALLQTVVYDIIMILMLGIPVLIVKLRRQPVRIPAGIDVQEAADASPSGSALFVDDQHPVTTAALVPLSEPVESPVEAWQPGRELRFAAETCLAAWFPTAAIKLTMVWILEEDVQHPFLEMIMNGVGVDVLLLIAITAVVLAPLMEELLYRVVILGGLLNHPRPTRMSTTLAIGVTSVLFAFAHGFPDSVALLPLAVAIGWTYHQRRSYRTVVLVHVLFNGFNILLAGLGLV